MQRGQADTGALGCSRGGPLGAQAGLADRQAPAQAAWGILHPVQATLRPRLQVLSLSMHNEVPKICPQHHSTCRALVHTT